MLFSVLQLAVVFGVIFVGLRRRWALELTLGTVSLALALCSGIFPQEWPRLVLKACWNQDLLALLCAIAGMLTLSGIMEASGQSQRLVGSVERVVHSSRIRLLIFPALIGLLPMPGGALFSCPLVDAVARSIKLTKLQQAEINIWFRHVWESVWPLYPGFVLYVAISNLSPLSISLCDLPICFAGLAFGWFFFLRRIPNETIRRTQASEKNPDHGNSILRSSLPLIVGVGSAFVLRAFFPDCRSGFSFAAGLLLGSLICLVMNHLSPTKLLPLVTNRRAISIFLSVIAIYLFKETLAQSGLLASLASLTSGNLVMLFAACILLPFISAMFTGLWVAIVGVSYPILLSMIQAAGQWDSRLLWLTLATMCSYAGQMISPLHLCIIITCKYFNVSLSQVLRSMLVPTAMLFITAIAWFGILKFFW